MTYLISVNLLEYILIDNESPSIIFIIVYFLLQKIHFLFTNRLKDIKYAQENNIYIYIYIYISIYIYIYIYIFI